jgi:hypothetical protein
VNGAQQPLWRTILFYRLTEVDRRFVRWLFARHPLDWLLALIAMPARYRKTSGELALGFDSGWLRWLGTLLVFPLAANIAVTVVWAQWVALVANVSFASVLCLYFAHLLFRRLQCSLLELCVVIAMLGNVEGLLLTTPIARTMGIGWALPLALVLAAWILYGAVLGLVQARMVGVVSPLPRILLLLGAWLTTLAPALILAGTILAFGHSWQPRIIPRNLVPYGIAMLVVGALSLFLRIGMGWFARRVALKQLAPLAPAR